MNFVGVEVDIRRDRQCPTDLNVVFQGDDHAADTLAFLGEFVFDMLLLILADRQDIDRACITCGVLPKVLPSARRLARAAPWVLSWAAHPEC